MKPLKTFLVLFICVIFNCYSQIRVTYVYDNAHRLIKEMYSDGKQKLFSYDQEGNIISIVTIVPCLSSDLIISDIQITKYTPEKIYYTLQIKNIGTQTANLSSFAFAAYNSNSRDKDNSSEFKSALFTGGSLTPNATMNINYSSGFNFNNNKYYLILTADNYNSVVECVETNNNMAKLINPCTENTNLNITGSHSNRLLSSNGIVTISNAFLDNVLVVGKSVEQLPNTELRNSSIVIGGCLNGIPIDPPPTNGLNLSPSSNQSIVSKISFSKENDLSFDLLETSNLAIEVYGDIEKALIQKLPNQDYSGNVNISIDTNRWIKGQKYIIHIISKETTEVFVVDF